MNTPPRFDSSLQATLHDLVNRCFSITLHRLRGVRGLVHGWLEIGVPETEMPRLRAHMEEDLVLLARLDWLRSFLHHSPPLERCTGGEAPSVFLAAALGLGTPEEAKERLPEIKDAEAALALSLWLQGCTTAYDSESIRVSWPDHHLEVQLAIQQDWPGIKAWRAQFGSFLVIEKPHCLRFRQRCFAPWPQALSAAE